MTTKPLPFVVKHSSTHVIEKVQQDVLASQLGDEPASVYESLILGAKAVSNQLNPEVININKQVAQDLEGINTCPSSNCAMACLYNALLTALVLYQQLSDAGVL